MMNIYFNFSVAGFSNCYIIGPEGGGNAVVVDPGVMNVPLLRTIEDNEYKVTSVLLTHAHSSHVQGLKTFLKIYDAEIFANAQEVHGVACTRIVDNEPFDAHGITVVPIAVAGHSSDSVVYKVDPFLFTGDVLGAGRIGTAPNAYAKALLEDAIKERLFTLHSDYLIFPGHGAPSTLEAERTVNPLLS